jgi:hypothetical protein
MSHTNYEDLINENNYRNCGRTLQRNIYGQQRIAGGPRGVRADPRIFRAIRCRGCRHFRQGVRIDDLSIMGSATVGTFLQARCNRWDPGRVNYFRGRVSCRLTRTTPTLSPWGIGRPTPAGCLICFYILTAYARFAIHAPVKLRSPAWTNNRASREAQHRAGLIAGFLSVLQ